MHRRRNTSILVLFALSALPAARAQVDLLAAWDGQQVGEQFGIRVALGGDANGDGWADLAVGASANDVGGENAGKVSIYFGRALPSAVPDLELYGNPGSFFGSAVAWAGDVNGDGYDDLLVGAFRDSQAGVNAGQAYLYLGGNPMSLAPALALLGPAAGAYFGRAVCGGGDLNGDGRADVCVGAPRTANGSVYIYFGSASPDSTPDLILHGAAEGDRFGEALASAGNADGLPGDDLLVGAPRASTGGFWCGAAYLFSGGPALDAVPDWICVGVDAGDQFGTSLAAAGDVNGDGAPDLIVGAPYRNAGQLLDVGAAYLFHGGVGLDASPDHIFTGQRAEEHLGAAVGGCGDVTGSGFSHVVIGAPDYDNAGSFCGRVLLCPGGNPISPAGYINLYGEGSGAEFGGAVAGAAAHGARSFSGSFLADFSVGAWGQGQGGKCYLYGREADLSGVIAEPVAGSMPELFPRQNPSRIFELMIRWTGAGLVGIGLGGAASLAVEACIITTDGRMIRRLPVLPGDGSSGVLTVHWDGCTDRGTRAPAGLYLCRVRGLGAPVRGGRLVLLR